jgi:tRNA A-37 threonylcarbamoyl transferase component Bud32/tetratricopeptide (TPR) repeat protein
MRSLSIFGTFSCLSKIESNDKEGGTAPRYEIGTVGQTTGPISPAQKARLALSTGAKQGSTKVGDGQRQPMAENRNHDGPPGSAEGDAAIFAKNRAFEHPRYRVLRKLGEGGMGTVYEAYDLELARKIAIKVIKQRVEGGDDKTWRDYGREHLLLEARNLARLSHPNIVPIFDVGTLDDGSIFMAMEFIEGPTLREIFSRSNYSVLEKFEFVLQAGEALAAAHALGMLHRDFKPENIMLRNDGRVCILDFGLAQASSETAPNIGRVADTRIATGADEEQLITAFARTLPSSSPGDLERGIGTPAYMAPEQALGQACHEQSDLFALAVIAYECLVGKRPFVSQPLSQRLAEIERQRLPWPRSVPSWLRGLIAQAMDFQLNDRTLTVSGFVKAVRQGQARSRRRKRGAVSGALAVAMAGVVTLAAISVASPPARRCPSGETLLGPIWTDEIEREVGQAFAKVGHQMAAELWPAHVAALNQWREAWIASSETLCVEDDAVMVPASLDPAMIEESRACLAECKVELATLLQIWQAPTHQQIVSSAASLASLTKPESCRDVEYLQQRAPLPADPTQRANVLALRSRFGALAIRIALVDFARALPELADLRREVLAKPELDLLARLAAELAAVEHTKRTRDPIAHQRAVLLGIASDQPRNAAHWLGQRWFIEVYVLNQPDNSEAILHEQEAYIDRAGRPLASLIPFFRMRGIWSATQGHPDEALRYFHASLDKSNELHGAKSLASANATTDLVITYNAQNRYDEAIRFADEGLRVSENAIPAGHPFRTAMRLAYSQALRGVGDVDGAILQAAQSWFECGESGMLAIVCDESLNELGMLALALGDYEGGIRLGNAILERQAISKLRANTGMPWQESITAKILLLRGEIGPAYDLSVSGLEKIRSEAGTLNSVQSGALLARAEVELALGNLATATRYLNLVKQLEFGGAGEFTYAANTLLIAAKIERELGHQDVELELLEVALAQGEKLNRPPDERAEIHCEFARTLLAAGHLELAKWHAEEGLQLRSRQRELSPTTSTHFFVDHFLVLAEIALARRQPKEALALLDRAHAAFDEVAVLDNRRAPLWFAQAQAWSMVDASESAREEADRLARQALKAYLDWDRGSKREVESVLAWLRGHPSGRT